MKLIGSLNSPYVRKVRIVMAEKRLDYQLEIEDVWAADDIHEQRGLRGVARNGWEMPPFLFGNYLALALVGVGLWLRRRDRTTIALLAISAIFPLGYAVFWGISLSASFARVSGPIYFVPLLLPISVLVAAALVAAWKRAPTVALVLAVVTAVNNANAGVGSSGQALLDGFHPAIAVSLIAALLLLQFGTGPIRGFAVTLIIGLLSNVFTAVFVSRTMFEVVLARRQQAQTLSI